ncbi:MAG: hypothetical protein ACRYGP_13210 [Janthinobacterium lividum]
MAKAKAQRLKVFQAHLGFYDTVVAAPSQAAALRAWGTHQNLFADGQARISEDPQAVAAALAHPETPLKRAVGSTDAFALETVNLPTVPEAPKTSRPAAKPKPAAPPKPPADRSALDAAEAALRALDAGRKAEEAELRRRQDQLDADRKAAQSAYVEHHKAAALVLTEARTAYRRAGGEG